MSIAVFVASHCLPPSLESYHLLWSNIHIMLASEEVSCPRLDLERLNGMARLLSPEPTCSRLRLPLVSRQILGLT